MRRRPLPFLSFSLPLHPPAASPRVLCLPHQYPSPQPFIYCLFISLITHTKHIQKPKAKKKSKNQQQGRSEDKASHKATQKLKKSNENKTRRPKLHKSQRNQTRTSTDEKKERRILPAPHPRIVCEAPRASAATQRCCRWWAETHRSAVRACACACVCE
jgi:hypothetical protein